MMRTPKHLVLDAAERGWLPDGMIRFGIRRLLAERLREIDHADETGRRHYVHGFIEQMKASTIALMPGKANEQHYEVPAQFFQHVLGPHMKYSSAYWPDDSSELAEAEAASLAQTCEHARIADGMRILELGCGWGSLTLWMAEHYPAARIRAVSNSHSQRCFILEQVAARGLSNVEVITCDMNDYDDAVDRYDRVVSVEMFEHMRNYQELYRRIHTWLKPDGLFFKHIFVHRDSPYLFEDRDPSDWMSRHFFSGGMMPSDDLPSNFQEHLELRRHWQWNGTHYARTLNTWLTRMDRERERLWPLFVATYGETDAGRWWMRWRIFFMACAELFAYEQGQQWWVSHYLFANRKVLAACS